MGENYEKSKITSLANLYSSMVGDLRISLDAVADGETVLSVDMVKWRDKQLHQIDELHKEIVKRLKNRVPESEVIENDN